MLGFVIGTICLIGLVKVLRHGRHGYGGYGYGGGCGSRRWGGGRDFGWGGGWGGDRGGPYRGHGGFGGHEHGERGWGSGWGGGWGGDRGGAGFMLRAIFEQIDATPEQERVIVKAVDEVRDEARKQRDELGKTRADIAKAMRSPSFDEVLLGELFARHDTVMEAMRRTVTGALAKVHVVLDDKQRERVADLIERGPGSFRPFRRSRGYEA